MIRPTFPKCWIDSFLARPGVVPLCTKISACITVIRKGAVMLSLAPEWWESVETVSNLSSLPLERSPFLPLASRSSAAQQVQMITRRQEERVVGCVCMC
jgi:hypothetical protein